MYDEFIVEMAKEYLKIQDDSQNNFLNMLALLAKKKFSAYTSNKFAGNRDYDYIIVQMIIEDYNRYGSEGIKSLSFGSNHETTLEDYSIGLQKLIKKAKRMKVL